MADIVELVVKRAQKCLEAIPVMVLGSGASAAHNIPGMGALRDHLVSSIQPTEEDSGYSVWQAFTAQLLIDDLETSLQKVQLNQDLLNAVIAETWKLINRADLLVFEQLLRGEMSLPLTELFRYMFTSTRKTITVVTPNYDRLAEYAADAGDFAHRTGFGHGHLRYRDSSWGLMRGRSPARTVDIWKVHGSLDWFKRPDDTLIAVPPRESLPEGLVPSIVTPGVTKYQIALQEPFRSAINQADNALHRAAAYLCIGYGFNDEHIQPKLIERVTRDSVPLVVITRSLTDSAKTLLLGGRCKDFLALETDGNSGTRAFCPEYMDGVVLPGMQIWNLRDFLNSTVLDVGRARHATV
ncbi:MAG: SIR2 family protein [Bacillota bacterium]